MHWSAASHKFTCRHMAYACQLLTEMFNEMRGDMVCLLQGVVWWSIEIPSDCIFSTPKYFDDTHYACNDTLYGTVVQFPVVSSVLSILFWSRL